MNLTATEGPMIKGSRVTSHHNVRVPSADSVTEWQLGVPAPYLKCASLK